ncbi:MAG: DUF294 nucleotidyltransferase-like domain-containing protein [Betaproteobacteria bacterium]|nr:DUF294 nucleotidyltransferase-like domain-containing protein [Betaproteobacteria bacterium]
MPQVPAPPNHTALIALPVAVLDLETTGLDVRSDRIVQIGIVKMRGAKISGEPRIDQLIHPDGAIPAAATRIHGIADDDVADAPRFAEYGPALREALSGCVVVGHHIAFDLAVLRHEAARTALPWHEPPSLDLALLLGALEPTLPDLGLETVTRHLGVEIRGRHTAMGDCLATAEAFERLIPLLREADVRTLGEARALAGRRSDILLQQVQSGWDAVPGEHPAAIRMPPPRVDSFVFERRLGDLMRSPPVRISGDSTLGAAARAMTEQGIGALLVGRAEAPPEGILTERDLLRVVAEAPTDLDRVAVRDAMTSPVVTVVADEMLYRAIGRMDRHGFRHLCVVDAQGIAVGMLSQRDLLHHRARSTVVLGEALAEAEDVGGLASAFSTVPSVAQQLVADGLLGADIARIISEEMLALSARAAELTLARLSAEGWGAPPAPWCLIVLGSAGRGESLLGADQDNALIHAGSRDNDPWFAELGKGIADLLDQAGIARCKGGVMAANTQWRGTREEWIERVDGWLRRAQPADLLNVDIFFDLAAAAGDASLARALRSAAVRAASQSPPFIGLLAQSVASLAPRFGLFRRLRSEKGRFELKRDGLLPLVSLARTLALSVGSAARSTPERLRDAAAAGRLSEGDALALIEGHARLLTWVLRQQLLDLDEGVRPSGRVALKALGRTEIARLHRDLRRVDDLVGALRGMVGGHRFAAGAS